MNSEFTLSQGAGQKLEFAVQRNGGTPEDIDYLSTGENFRTVTLLRTGKAKLVEVTESGSEGAVIPTAPTPTAWTVDDEGNIHFTLTPRMASPANNGNSTSSVVASKSATMHVKCCVAQAKRRPMASPTTLWCVRARRSATATVSRRRFVRRLTRKVGSSLIGRSPA